MSSIRRKAKLLHKSILHGVDKIDNHKYHKKVLGENHSFKKKIVPHINKESMQKDLEAAHATTGFGENSLEDREHEAGIKAISQSFRENLDNYKLKNVH